MVIHSYRILQSAYSEIPFFQNVYGQVHFPLDCVRRGGRGLFMAQSVLVFCVYSESFEMIFSQTPVDFVPFKYIHFALALNFSPPPSPLNYAYPHLKGPLS